MLPAPSATERLAPPRRAAVPWPSSVPPPPMFPATRERLPSLTGGVGVGVGGVTLLLLELPPQPATAKSNTRTPATKSLFFITITQKLQYQQRYHIWNFLSMGLNRLHDGGGFDFEQHAVQRQAGHGDQRAGWGGVVAPHGAQRAAEEI